MQLCKHLYKINAVVYAIMNNFELCEMIFIGDVLVFKIISVI